MAAYVQAPESETWHWCKNCVHYPTHIAKQSALRPAWGLCEQCKSKQREGTCNT